MAHFADGKWNTVTGLIASASGAPSLAGTLATVNGVANVETVGGTGVESGTPALFINSATPQTLLTLTVPRAGMYKIHFYAKCVTAVATSTASVRFTGNDGAAITTQAMPGFRNGGTVNTLLDAATANASLQNSIPFFVAAGTVVTVDLVGITVSGSATVQAYAAIEAV